MKAVLHGSWVDYVIYMGLTERYPDWFREEVLDDIYMDEHRFTFWKPEEERPWDYYEKDLVETDSVFLRKPNGEIFKTSRYVFEQLYVIFIYDGYSNHGIAAFQEDCIDFVECQPGVLSAGYPGWFYEFFTESIHLPNEESIFIYEPDVNEYPVRSMSKGIDISQPLNEFQDQVSVDHHCVFLRNFLGEIRHMVYSDFIKHYHPGPIGGFNYES